MHILYVADGDSKYGAPNSLLQLVSEIRKIDSTLKVSVVVTKNSDRIEDYQKLGCDVYRVFMNLFTRVSPTSIGKFL